MRHTLGLWHLTAILGGLSLLILGLSAATPESGGWMPIFDGQTLRG